MLEQTVAGISFSNPILTASGCFGFGMEYKDLFDPNILGGVTLKTLTLEPTLPLPEPRMAEVDSGILHKIGWENPGLEGFSKMIRFSIEKNLHIPIIASIGGKSPQEYVLLAEALSKYPFIRALELDVSSLHTPAEFFSDETIIEIAKCVGATSPLPIFVKLGLSHIRKELILELEQQGIGGFSLINSPPGVKINEKKCSPFFGKGIYGSLSGSLLKPLALKALFDVRQWTKLPIIAMGGITRKEDVLEFLLLGANLVAIGSGFFKNPLCAKEILDILPVSLKGEKISHIQDLIGKAL